MRHLLIVSDNHGERQALEDLLSIYQDEVDYFLHLGDSEFSDLDKLWQEMIPIKGNNDFGEGYIEETVIGLADHRIFACHGHLYDVYQQRNALAQRAKEKSCQIACYGHTHVPLVENIDDVLLINPGSIARPRGTIQKKLYAILSLEGKNYYIRYYDDNHREYEVLSCEGHLS